MQRTTLVFPVLAGKTEADIWRIADRFQADPEGYFESRQRAGVTLERAYSQHTPMGDFVVAYAESDRSAADVIGTYSLLSVASFDDGGVAVCEDVLS